MSIKIIDANNRFRARWERLGPNALQIMFSESISNIPNHTIIFVWDGMNGTAARRAILPDYKGGDKKAPSDQFFETIKLFQDILQHSNCIQISVDDVEADDVIAAIARNSTQQIEIDSNDADFLALVSERITVNRDPLVGVIPDFVHLYKTLVGDKSDNVKGLKSFGEKTWSKLEDSERIMLVKHFEGEQRLTGQDCAELFDWTKALCKNWDENIELLDKYWQVTSFFDVTESQIQQGMTVGKLDMVAAQVKLGELLLTMDNDKAA